MKKQNITITILYMTIFITIFIGLIKVLIHNMELNDTILLSASFRFSKRKIKQHIKQLLSEGIRPEHFLSKSYSLLYGADFIKSVIDDYFASKAAQIIEQKLEKRRARAAAKKEAFDKFYNDYDLYTTVCNILGFDIKFKLKSIALNSKWVTVKNHQK